MDLSFLQEQANDTRNRALKQGYADGYKAATDEFAKEMKKMCKGIVLAEKHINEVAKRMKTKYE